MTGSRAAHIRLENSIAAKLEALVPRRRRAAFIQEAIRRALWAIEEAATAEAYRRQPDSPASAHMDPSVWEPRAAPPRPSRRHARR